MFYPLSLPSVVLFDPARLPVALAALGLTAFIGVLTGPLASNGMPFYWVALDRLFGTVGTKLDRRQRKPGDLMLRGFLLLILVTVLSGLLGYKASLLMRHFPLYRVPDILGVSVLLTSGAVWFCLMRLFRALSAKQPVKGAYYAMSRSTRLDLSGADDFTITRAGMGLAARAFDKGLVAPLFWYVIGGLPAAFVYGGCAAMAWRFGKDGYTKGFGTFPILLERLLGFAPTVLAGILMALGGLFTPTGGMFRALGGLLRGKGAPYAEGGLPLTAMAYALNVSLGGPAVDLDSSTLKRRWVGPPNATAKLEPHHLRRALYISIMAHLLLALGLGGLILLMDR
jgi:adenosylcobinamide-phosphate synthase